MVETKKEKEMHKWVITQKTPAVVEMRCSDCELLALGSIPLKHRKCKYQYRQGNILESLEGYTFSNEEYNPFLNESA